MAVLLLCRYFLRFVIFGPEPLACQIHADRQSERDGGCAVACLLLVVPGWTQLGVAMAKRIHMVWRATHWIVAAAIGSTVTTISCTRAPLTPDARYDTSTSREPIADNSVSHAFDTSIELRLVDRLELDNFLRDRDIRVHVTDGVANIAGEVWTPLERERAGEIIRHVPGVIDVVNELDIRPPR